jgi:hypothetical protein
MDYVSKENSCHSASIKFEVASNTARNGYKRYKLEGHDVSRKVGGKKERIREQEVATYVKNNSYKKSLTYVKQQKKSVTPTKKL